MGGMSRPPRPGRKDKGGAADSHLAAVVREGRIRKASANARERKDGAGGAETPIRSVWDRDPAAEAQRFLEGDLAREMGAQDKLNELTDAR